MSTIAHYINKGHSLKELEKYTDEELFFMYIAINEDISLKTHNMLEMICKSFFK